jgi:glucose-6-phosphate isomerase
VISCIEVKKIIRINNICTIATITSLFCNCHLIIFDNVMLTLAINAFNTTQAHTRLQEHFLQLQSVHMRDLFKEDEKRFEKFSIQANNILFDFSKNRITSTTMELLQQMVEECGLAPARSAYFNGSKINSTEQRAVLHTALRNRGNKPVIVDGIDVMPHVNAVLAQMKRCCEQIHSGEWCGFTGQAFTDVVNIGIGGSDLGPVMVTEALKPFAKNLKVHFVSNIDGSDIADTLKTLHPETTLFLIASKTFTTQETLANAHAARDWFFRHGARQEDVQRNFIAISTNEEAVTKFGISPERMFKFWDWVGGRFSLWSAIGLSIALYIGFDNFEQLLEGAYAADNHFLHQPNEKNVPVVMALLSVWYRNYFGAATHAILPYDQYLHRLPAFLQQAEMESNGKCVDRQGNRVGHKTSAVIWGEPGTNGQHAFFQLLHQGTELVPCDFIAAAHTYNPINDQHDILLANFIAQSEALMRGKTSSEVRQELENNGYSFSEIEYLLPFKTFEGNRPSNTFFLKQIDPFNLGMLLAFYEHKIFVEGLLWNINSYDQWGVELGKQMADVILKEIKEDPAPKLHDASTNALISYYKKWSKDQ